MKTVKFFKDITRHDAESAGGKGASLGEMTRAHIPVPPGFVVQACAFENFIAATGLRVEIQAALDEVDHREMHTVEHASEKIQQLILAATLPAPLKKEITAAAKKLRAEFMAVRSSATAEDSASAAWAGQLDTYLNTTEKTLFKNIQRCWASLFTPRAIFYRFEKGLQKSHISVAVVVQKMVQSEVAGVAFSVHPVTKDRNQLIIEAGFGLGEAVVSGSITPDSYVVDRRTWRALDISVSQQEKMIIKGLSGGSVWKNIPKAKQSKQKLDLAQITKLAKLVVHIEKHYGFPCDIEWALEKGNLFITQSRPITTL